MRYSRRTARELLPTAPAPPSVDARLGRLKEVLRPYYLRWFYFPLVPGARPECFERCWRQPFQRLASVAEPGGLFKEFPRPANRPDILIYPMTDWHTRIQRSQHLARAFAALGHRVVYLNPHFGRQFETVPAFDHSHRVSFLEPNILELHIRLPLEPVFHHRRLLPAEVATVRNALGRLLDRIGTRQALQLVSFPVWMEPAGLLRQETGFPILYDCHDLLEGFSNISRDLVAAEADALHTADLAVFSSRFLEDRWLHRLPELAGRHLLARNAVDPQALAVSPATAAELTGPPTAGYVGAIEEWFDIEALQAAVQANPESTFLVAGRIENPRAQTLRRFPNLQFLGELPPAELPDFLSRLRVGLIPFKVTDLTLAANPIKLYEYFSFGLPVVSSALPEVEAYGELIYVAGTPQEFAAQVRRALLENDERRRAERIAIAGRETWRVRAEALLAALPAARAKQE